MFDQPKSLLVKLALLNGRSGLSKSGGDKSQ